MDHCDVSPKMKELHEKKQKQRAAAKAYYQNLVQNPYRPVNDGLPFEPALFRYNAMSAYHVECFKPSPKSYFKFFTLMSPIFFFYFFFKNSKEKKEELLRSGVVKYEDRSFRYIN